MLASKNNIQSKESTRIAQKRAMVDYKRYKEGSVKKCEYIYCVQDENDILKFKVMILGPMDTPYENGYYFFNITLSHNHPFDHPSAIYFTQGEGTRFHPNLYTNGKVCLSILGTWPGPCWTSLMNLETLLLNIRGIMDDNPITNEPGYEKIKRDSLQSIGYNRLLTYQNINVAVCNMIKNPPQGFEIFKPEMMNLFRKNYDSFMKYVNDNIELEGKSVSYNGYGGYNSGIKYKITNLKSKLENIYSANINLFLELALKEEEELKNKPDISDS